MGGSLASIRRAWQWCEWKRWLLVGISTVERCGVYFMNAQDYIKNQPEKIRRALLDEMFGTPRKLFEVTFNAWAEAIPGRDDVVNVTRAVFFGVSAKTKRGARLKVLDYMECTKPSFEPQVEEQK